MSVVVSVIVPCHNEEAVLARCLAALENQSYRADSFEILLADNGSTDGSVAIARRFGRVRLVEVPERGSYAARNRLLGLATGSLVAFTDADCEPGRDWLRTIVAAFDDPGTHLVLGANRFASETFFLRVRADYETEKLRHIFQLRDPRYYYTYTNNLAVRRACFEACGVFDTMLRGADLVFGSRVIGRYGCEAARFVPSMEVRHLEITTCREWFAKLWIYGRNYRNYGPGTGYRPLSFIQRLSVQRAMLSRPGGDVPSAAWCFCSDLLGSAAYILGRISGRLWG